MSKSHKKLPTGAIGEKIAENYLTLKGHSILERNYLKPYGEIDIITEYNGIVHFVEVKAENVRYGSDTQDHEYNPLEKVHSHKQENLKKVIEVYIVENNVEKWQVDVIAVLMNSATKKADITHLKNVIL